MSSAGARRSWRAAVEVLLWRHGAWAPLTMAFVLAAAALWQWRVRPISRQLEVAEASLRAPRPAPARTGPSADELSDHQRLAAIRGVLEPYSRNVDIMRRVIAATLQELQWSQAEFQQSQDRELDVVRVQVTVPVVGEYRRLRQGLEQALREAPGMSLDQLSFRRSQPSQSQLEARLKLSLWLTPSRPTGRVAVDEQEGAR